MVGLAVLFLFCFFVVAFLAGSEMAFVSSNRVKLRESADSGNLAARRILHLHRFGHEFLTILLVGNNTAQIVLTAIVAYCFEVKLGWHNEWAVTAFTAPLLIVFGETVPKDYCRIKAQPFLLKYSLLLDFLLRIFGPSARFLLRGVDFLTATVSGGGHRSIFVSEKEFRVLIEEGARAGVLAAHGKKLIDTILDFERITVEAAMIPLEKAPKAEITATVGALKEIARRTHAPMVLVYEEVPSLVVGMVYIFDLLFEEREDLTLSAYLRSPVFLSRETSIEKAFLTLQAKRQSYAVVTHRGDVIGTVAIEKLFVR